MAGPLLDWILHSDSQSGLLSYTIIPTPIGLMTVISPHNKRPHRKEHITLAD